jgi:uncharacterized membrane protein YfcA
MDFLIFILVGTIVGFLAGLFGIGGGGLIVPVLIFSYEHAGVSPAVLTHIAISTSLFVILFASLMSAFQHGRQGTIDTRAALVIGGSSAVTALATTAFAAGVSGRFLKVFFCLLIFTTALRMLFEGSGRAREETGRGPRPGLAGLSGVGFLAGVTSALAGVGGGGVTIPVMHYFLKMPIKAAIGTSSAAIVITALFSVAGYIVSGTGRHDLPGWTLGFVDLQRGAALVIGSLIMARLGARVSFRTQPYRLKKMFALFLAAISIYMALFR